ncbi:MAG: hypothetical protein IKR69_00925 [Bacteroidales bacterium]|nr:hypothetical protein [Bacteroidales bacterium]
MEREDPLERIAREEAERKAGKGLGTMTIVLLVIAIALAAALGYIWYQKSSLVNELEDEKVELENQMLALQNDFATLSSDYDKINSQLDTSREQVALLIDKLQKTEATNRAKIRQYEKELGTLRSIMKGYIVQIDSLNTANKRLRSELSASRRESEDRQRQNEDLTRAVENLSEQVAAGSAIKGRGVSLLAYNSHDKVTDRSSRTVYLVTNLSLLENDLAEHGPVTVYVRVKDPEGIVLTNTSSREFSSGGAVMMASASRTVDYEGAEVDMSIYVKDTGEFIKGMYSVEVYTSKSMIGKAELLLR